jgi:hypothetical protein
MIQRLRKKLPDGGEHVWAGAGGKHIAPRAADMLHNLTHVFHRFALTEHDFRESLPKPPMVVYLRKSEVLIGQVTKGL